MKLLILTQKVDINDDVLGFMHGWIREFAKHCESVIVVCLKKGEYDLSKNVKVLSLGKEKGESRIKYVFNFYKYIWQERNNYDKVFAHMNYEYVILGWLLWRLMGKRMSFWYAHGHVPLGLKIAEKLAHIIFTSTKSGFRLKSKKINVVGQGIDVDKFKAQSRGFGTKSKTGKIFKIVTIGRISPVKDYETLIKAVEILNKEDVNLKVNIIGGVGLVEQEKYLSGLKKMAREKKLDNVIDFVGAVPNKDIINYLQSADLFVNMSNTGSLDKAMVEAMACELPVLTCNEAMEEVLGESKNLLMYDKGNYEDFVQKIIIIKNMEKNKRESLGKKLREIVKNNHSQDRLIKKIINILNK